MGKRSKLWYILPLFFGLGGGTTAWFMLKFGILVKKESGKFFSFTDFPFRLWVLGVIVSVIFWTLQIVEFGLAQRAVMNFVGSGVTGDDNAQDAGKVEKNADGPGLGHSGSEFIADVLWSPKQNEIAGGLQECVNER